MKKLFAAFYLDGNRRRYYPNISNNRGVKAVSPGTQVELIGQRKALRKKGTYLKSRLA